MAITTTAVLNSKLSWSEIDSTDGRARIVDTGAIGTEKSIIAITGATPQTGINVINTIWHDTKTLPSGGSHFINFYNLSRSIFGGTQTISFSGGQVREIIIENQSETARIAVVSPATSGFNTPFYGNNSSGIICHPTCSTIFANTRSGWTITSGNNTLNIKDIDGSGVQYKIAIGGVV